MRQSSRHCLIRIGSLRQLALSIVRLSEQPIRSGQSPFHPKTAKTTGRYTPYSSASRNRMGWPIEAVTSSPCHITVLPRTMVPTGQPVTVTPS